MSYRCMIDQLEDVRSRQNVRRAGLKGGWLILFSPDGNDVRACNCNNLGTDEKSLDFSHPQDTIKLRDTSEDGGPGSGNFGHSGRPGEVGGSAQTTSVTVKDASGKSVKFDIPDADIRECVSEIKAGKQNSMEGHIDKDGNISAERRQVHAAVIASHFEGISPESGTRVATILGGGPASGKSSVLSSGVVNTGDADKTITVDPDHIKGLLPGYKEMSVETESAAGVYHEESSALAKNLYSQTLEYGANAVYDGTGDGSVKSLMKKINEAKEAGYKANGEYVTVDVEEAVRRNQKRYEDGMANYLSGKSSTAPRMPDPDLVRKKHAAVTDISVECAASFDCINIWDNNVPKGSAPILIATGGSGNPLKAVDAERFQKYLDKGEKSWVLNEKGEAVPAE